MNIYTRPAGARILSDAGDEPLERRQERLQKVTCALQVPAGQSLPGGCSVPGHWAPSGDRRSRERALLRLERFWRGDSKSSVCADLWEKVSPAKMSKMQF